MKEDNDSQSSHQQRQPKGKLRFDEEQYKLLKECSDNEDIANWNKYRQDHPDKPIWLDGAKLQGKNLTFANLQGAQLFLSRLQGANLQFANLKGATLFAAELQNADLIGAELQGGRLQQAKLQDADFLGAELQSTELQSALFNNSTNFYACRIDQNTDFRDTALDSIIISSGDKYLLKYNIRRLNWEGWYKNHHCLQWAVRPFWWISDYGISTGRIIGSFLILALIFAAFYYFSGLISNSGIVNSLFIGKEGPVPNWLVPIRSIYFSIVTMTTLGFGDMHANCQSFWGHLLLTFQVILGYLLLGALVTRLAVLFTTDGPAGSFTPMDKETKELLAKLKKDEKNIAKDFLEKEIEQDKEKDR